MDDAIAVIQEVIDDNGYSPKTIARLREAIALLKTASIILNRVELLLSGANSEKLFLNQYPESIDNEI